jgi:hypothetical protein
MSIKLEPVVCRPGFTMQSAKNLFRVNKYKVPIDRDRIDAWYKMKS